MKDVATLQQFYNKWSNEKQKSIKRRKQEEEEVLCFYIRSTEWLKGIDKLKKMDKRNKEAK